MSDTYVKKINDTLIAAAEATPSSPLATVIAGKQDSLGINPTSGNASLFLNEKGEFVSTATQDTKTVRHVVIENYLQIEIKRGNNHRHASITIFGDNGSYPFIANIGFQFLTAPGSGENAGFQTPPVLSMVECNNLSSNAYVPNVWYVDNGSSGSSYIYCKWSSNKRLTLLLNTFDPNAIVTSDVSSLPSGAVAAGNGHSLPHITGINTAVGSPTVPVYISAAGEVLPATGVAPGHVAYENTNEINYANVPTTGNKSRHWFNYLNGDTNRADSSNLLTDYYFGNRNQSVDGVYLHAEGWGCKIIKGPSGTSGKNYTTVIKFVDGSNTADGFLALRCVICRSNNDGAAGFVDIVIKRRNGTYWYSAYKSVRSGNFGVVDPDSTFGQVTSWSSTPNHYIGIATNSYTSPIAVFVQYAELNGAFTYELGDFVSSVSSITAEEVDTRDLCAGKYLATPNSNSSYMTYEYYGDSTIGSGSTGPQVQSYWETMRKTTSAGSHAALIYNSAGAEYSLLLHKRYDKANEKNYGTALRWGYNFPYIEMMRHHPTPGWLSTDWEPLCQPSVLTFEYNDTSSGKESLYNELLKYRTILTTNGSSNTTRHPIVFLYKDDAYYMLSSQGGGGGQYGGSSTWSFTRVVGSSVDRISFTASWDNSSNYTYSWGTDSGVANDVSPKHLKSTYYSSDGNQTIDISENTRHYEVQLNSYASAVTIDLDCSKSSTCTAIVKLVDKITAAQCGGLYIRWRDECGAYHRYLFDHMNGTRDPVGLQVSIKKVTMQTCGSPTYAIARVTLIPGEYNS